MAKPSITGIKGHVYERIEAYDLQHILSSKALDIYCDSDFTIWSRDEEHYGKLYAMTLPGNDVFAYNLSAAGLEENLLYFAGEED